MWFGDIKVEVNRLKVVIGLGASGLASIDYLLQQGEAVVAMDSNSDSPGALTLKQEHPDVSCLLGPFDDKTLVQAEEIIISPGVSLQHPDLIDAQKRGQTFVGDIELFVRATQKPVYAVTGSNGKTTVTSLLGEMVKQAGMPLGVAGNIGRPVLELLDEPSYMGYVLELSSFQLETTPSLKAKAAIVLNVSPDHMDRYQDFSHYRQAKQLIYRNAHQVVVNADDPTIWQTLTLPQVVKTVSIAGKPADFSLQQNHGATYLSAYGQPLLDVNELPLKGRHQWQNALSALAMGELMRIPQPAMLATLKSFRGLPHRCQWVREKQGITWYNDSKATNVGATETAITSFAASAGKNIILLAGGQAKGADFSALDKVVAASVKEVILFGEDAAKLAEALQHSASLHFVATLEDAVVLAAGIADSGDVVLLSPACASFDMFNNFMDRGEHFIKAVEAL